MTTSDVREVRLDAILAVRCQMTGDTEGLMAVVNANEDRVADFLAALLALAGAGFAIGSSDPVALLDQLAERTRTTVS